MKSLFAFVLPVVIAASYVTPVAAQFGARSGSLGGGFASRGMSRPLGGIAPGFTGLGPNRNFPNNFSNRNFGGTLPRRPIYGYPYAYSVWVPDYFDYVDYQNQYAAQYGQFPGATAPAAPQQPVIINQYFGAPAPAENSAPPPPNANTNTNTNSTPAPGDAIGSPQNYYLIAYKNHAIYAALAYWVEDNTLHYVTTQNTHNQASLDLIDISLSKSLNQGRETPFSVPGK